MLASISAPAPPTPTPAHLDPATAPLDPTSAPFNDDEMLGEKDFDLKDF